jgi:hypothetical protein
MSLMSLTHQQKIDQIELGDQNSEKTKIKGTKKLIFKIGDQKFKFFKRGGAKCWLLK